MDGDEEEDRRKEVGGVIVKIAILAEEGEDREMTLRLWREGECCLYFKNRK